MPPRQRNTDDEGSVLVLTLGYAVLAVALLVVAVNATSLALAQHRLEAVADAAALAGADGFELHLAADDGEPVVVLADADVHAQAAALVSVAADAGDDVRLVDAGTPDGVSARVVVASTWRPILLSPFVPGGVALSAEAIARTAAG
ncbi:pilus assembly protein TadG-related protein [Microbacterium sp. LRZ72]|uniref:pilus assembly protein TadG-related protein n=1 Tax=Microbacterium sp. LRZ72 TaxID=2942481 RepID=UPI0029B3B2A0|nr:pilus assembly protein TadG-related protein [Microbacterium sp. LRZ72]MDX2377904.1 pilus assembly protein TadG-related protein [Microbacterium sp. LRZ72]